MGVTDQVRPFWLSVLGKSGTGKTHCAKQLWGLASRLFFSGAKYMERFIYWPTFVEELREKIRESVGMGELLDMAKWPLLVLDDIGSDRDPSGFATDKLNTLLNMRVGKWTVITSNLDLAGLSKIDDRIASRIVREPGNLVIQMTTQDYGLRK